MAARHVFYDETCFKAAIGAINDMYSEKVGISGNVNDMFLVLSDVDFTTSPGFPYMGNCPTKKQAWEKQLDELVQRVDDHMRHSGTVVWYVFPKSEPVTVAKYNMWKFRTIVAAPFDFLLYNLMVFKEQNAKMEKAGFGDVGYVIEYGGYQRLLEKFEGYDSYLEVDGVHFDRSLPVLIMDAVRQLRRHWHSDPASVDYCYSHVIYSVLLIGDGSFCYKCGGNCSGNLNTLLDNTLATRIFEAYVCHRKNYNYFFFRSRSHSYVLGDDFFVAMMRLVIITYAEFKQYAHELGMEYELASESKELEGHSLFGKISKRLPNGKFIGIANTSKMLCRLRYLSPSGGAWAEQITAAYIHAYPDLEARTLVTNFAKFFYEHYGCFTQLPRETAVWFMLTGEWGVEEKLTAQ